MNNLLAAMAADLLIPPSMLGYVIRSSQYRYKRYPIPKRGGGARLIAQPSKAVKKLQNWAIKNILKKFTPHHCSTAYSEGDSIGKNATIHKDNLYIVKMDFEDFFHSIKHEDFKHFIKTQDKINLSEPDITLLCLLFFYKPNRNTPAALSIGAPSSPILSNIILTEFDKKIHDRCTKIGVTYTRYADDMTFSTNRKELYNTIINIVEDTVLNTEHPKLKINTRKTVVASKGNGRRITGITITNTNSISIGRDRKRNIRAKACQYHRHGLNEEEEAQLQGLLAFAYSIEPNFVSGLMAKFPKTTTLFLKKTDN